MSWYLEVLRKYAVFTGRARRKEYWHFFLISTIVAFLFAVIDVVNGQFNAETGRGLFSTIYILAVLVPGFAVTVRRLHDTDRSGWWLLIALIPLLGGLVLLVLMMQGGTTGENRFGADPKEDVRALPAFRVSPIVDYGVYSIGILCLSGLLLLASLGVRFDLHRIVSNELGPIIVTDDLVAVDGRAYAEKTPKRFHFVTFESPVEPRTLRLQQVIGLPGDRIVIDETGWATIRGTAFYNGTDNDAKRWLDGSETVVEIPEDSYFTYAGQWDRTPDGRHFGPIPLSQINGRVAFIYWPLSRIKRFPETPFLQLSD